MSAEGELKIYNKEVQELPPFISKNQEGRLVFNQTKIKEGGSGAYHYVYDFGHSKDSLKGVVDKDKQIILQGEQVKNPIPNVTFLGLDKESPIAQHMARISEIANDPNKSYKNPNDRREYREELKGVYKTLAHEVKKKLDGQKACFFCPKNGGIFVQDVFQEEGIEGDYVDYRLSRILMNEEGGGDLMVGTTFNGEEPKYEDYDTFVFADDCMATDISATATLTHLGDRLKGAGKDMSKVKIIISLAAGVQRGVENLMSKDALDSFGLHEGQVEAVVGIPVFQMTDEFYLQHPDGNFVVGDMGRWTRKPEDEEANK